MDGSQHAHRDYEDSNDSDSMSEGSFEGELSSMERRLHQHALVSSHSSDVYYGSPSSDDEKFEQNSKFQAETSPLYNYTCSSHSEGKKQNVDDCLRVGQRPISDFHLYSKVGWGKHSLSRIRDVPKAFWPSWVYSMYDSYLLARKVAGNWPFFQSLQ